MDLDRLLHRAVAEIITEEELLARLRTGRPLRLKLGFDPTKPDLHLGHAVALRKLRQFQGLGHQVVLIVGDWTAQIGDPSGRDESRSVLSPEQVRANAQTYMEQFFKVVDKDRTEVRWQSEWFGEFTMADVYDLTRRFTLADMMEHETYNSRFKAGQPITIMELMYPLLQGYDSLAIDADVEFGGTDQKFNILVGRRLQAMLGKTPQSVFLVPLLTGADGRKMSKSFANTIDLAEPPEEMYGKVMSISDTVLIEYFTLTTDVTEAEIADMQEGMAVGTVNPRDLKMHLAREIVAQFHGPRAAKAAESEFTRIFQRRELPSDMPEFELTAPVALCTFLADAGLARSKSEAKRLTLQGAVEVDGQKVLDPDRLIPVLPVVNSVIRVGKRRFCRALLKHDQ